MFWIDRFNTNQGIRQVGIDSKIEGQFIQFKHSMMTIKTYNKGMHFRLNEELVELHSTGQ
jgi:hypothetical protein